MLDGVLDNFLSEVVEDYRSVVLRNTLRQAIKFMHKMNN
jgi:hypothetical protein